MESLSDSARILLAAIGVPIAVALLIVPGALLLRRHGQALHRASQAEVAESGRPILLPRPRTRAEAAQACRLAAWLPFLFAGFTAVLILVRATQPSGLIDAVVFVACGFGLRRCSRTAAATALVLYLLSVVDSYRQLGFFNPLAILYVAGLAWGVFVAFRFHWLPANEPPRTATA